jgi:serine/threonine protein kinase/tetratricopeptide (TPR) repeat protein
MSDTTETGADLFKGSDRFTVTRRIGQGGAGVVYEAHDWLRQMPVAVKTIPGGDPTALYRFKREFRSLSNITHRNLATLYELFADTTPCFFTMELVKGVTFLEYVRPSGSPNYERVSAALTELVAGLSALHAAKKLHRDVKPSNVLVEPDGRVVVLDFGLVMDLNRGLLGTFTERDWFGTLAYMAPEQASGDILTAAADWYAVGGLLFQALTGRLPFVGDAQAILDAKLARDGPRPYALNPDTPEALDRICTMLLRRDPDQRPSGNEIVDLLASRPTAAIHARASGASERPISFIGREAHLAALESACDSVRRDRSVVMLVHGPSGSGKTALVEHFLEKLSLRDDVLVLSGRCYERESVPYKALDDVVDFLSRYLAQLSGARLRQLLPGDASLLAELFPVLGSVIAADATAATAILDPGERRRRAVSAFRTLLSRLTADVRVVICIDDLQWGDLDSALLINELLGQAWAPGLFVLGTYRTEDAETSPCLGALLDGPPRRGMERRQLRVEPLSIGDARRLAGELLEDHGLENRDQAAAIARESGGSPLFVYELVAYLQGGDGLTKLPSSADDISLEYMLRRRLSRVPADTAHLLEIIAVAGQPLLEVDAFAAANLPRRDPGILAFLRSARLVRTRGAGDATAFEIYHDRIRETLLASLSGDVRRHCHQRLALTLEASGRAQPDTLAVHFFGAGDLTTAGRYYLTAADAAADAMAFDRAAEYYRLALKLQRPAEAESTVLRAKCGRALANAGRGWEAGEEYRAAREGADQATALELERLAGYQYCISGHVAEGRLALQEALVRVGETMPATPRQAIWPLVRDRALLRLKSMTPRDHGGARVSPLTMARIDAVWSVATGLSQIDLVTAAAFQARNLLLSLRAGEPYRVVRALALEAISCALEGTRRQQRVTALLTAARQIATRMQEPHALGMVALADGIAALSRGQWRDGEAALSSAEATFRTQCVGVIWELATLHHFRVWTLAFRGGYAEMMSYGHRVLDESRQRNDLYTPATIGMFVEPIERLLADDPDGSRHALKEVARRWTYQGLSLQRVMEHMQSTFIDLYVGDGKRAWDRLGQWWPELGASHLLRLEQMRIQMFHIRANCAIQSALATGSDRLLESAANDARRIARERAPWAEPEAQTIFAALAAQRGDRTGAAVLLGQAADRFDALDRGQFTHPARWQLGRLIGGDEGHRLTAEAASTMAEQGISNPERWVDLHLPGFNMSSRPSSHS